MRRNVFHSTHGPRRSGMFVAPRWPPSNVLSIFQFLTLGAYPPGQRSPKGEMTYYPPRSTILQNFSAIAQTVYEICVTKVFHVLAPGGLTPGPKFTKRGEDLVDSDIYHPAKFHRSMPTHARDIHYQNSCGQKNKQTNKQTVNDISTTCLSACVDNKQ